MASSRGRPAISVSIDTIHELVDMKFSVPKIAAHLGVSIPTIRRRMREAGIKITETYTTMTDNQLDDLIASMVLQYPNLGSKLMKGMLWSEHKIRVPEERLRMCMRRVDPIGVDNRRQANRAIVRRTYSVPHANYLWHVDTYLKLNRYNIVIRSAVDGKSRVCIYLEADTNNRAVSSLNSFMNGVHRYGAPLHCRTDKGSECVLIARYMITLRGMNGHFTGRSVRNQRIERYWGDVKRVASHFWDTMNAMEADGVLDIDDALHMNILHYVFIPRLNEALDKFREGWNDHPLSSESNNTPNQLFMLHSSDDSRLINNESDIERIYEDVLQYAPRSEPVDNVRYLQDAPIMLTDDQSQRLSAIEILRPSNSNGKDVYLECLQATLAEA